MIQVVILLVMLLSCSGFLNHVLWLIRTATSFLDIIIGILGCVIPPVGVLHGLYLFF